MPQKVTSGKVTILIPHRGESDYRQWRDWFLFGLQKPPGTSWVEMRGMSLTTLRTALAEGALNSDAEWFFWLDDDIIAPNNSLLTLLSHNLPIAAGLYWAKKRKQERGLAAWMKVSIPSQGIEAWAKPKDGYMSILPEQAGRLVQCDVTGLGCALTHRSIFEKLTKPWFIWEPPPAPSEDFWFFEKVSAELKIKPTIDMEIKARHIGVFSIEPDGSFTTLEV